MAYKNPIPTIDISPIPFTEDKIKNAGLGHCQFCDEDNKVVQSTSVTDLYCKDCLAQVIQLCKSAINEIKEFEKLNNVPKTKKKRVITEEELTVLEREKDEALARLMSGDVVK